jgi:hypothetical protein
MFCRDKVEVSKSTQAAGTRLTTYLPEVVHRGRTRSAWRLGDAAREARLHDHVGDKTGPSGLVRRSETAAVVAVEELVELHVVLEVGVVVEHVVAAVVGPVALLVLGKDVDQPVLDLLGDG